MAISCSEAYPRRKNYIKYSDISFTPVKYGTACNGMSSRSHTWQTASRGDLSYRISPKSARKVRAGTNLRPYVKYGCHWASATHACSTVSYTEVWPELQEYTT